MNDDDLRRLDLPVRVFNAIARQGIFSIAEVVALVEDYPEKLLSFSNFGPTSYSVLLQHLKYKGYHIAERDLSGDPIRRIRSRIDRIEKELEHLKHRVSEIEAKRP